MKRYFKAIVVGVLAWAAAMKAGMEWTDMELYELLYHSIIAYYLGMDITLKLIEPEEDPEPQQRTKREPQTFNLKEEGWNDI